MIDDNHVDILQNCLLFITPKEMTRQKLGRIAWERSYVNGQSVGHRYCIGYCHGCNAKQTIDRRGIEEFNKNTWSSDYLKLPILTKVNHFFFILKNLAKLRIKFEIKQLDID